jgi:hypothetical protein
MILLDPKRESALFNAIPVKFRENGDCFQFGAGDVRERAEIKTIDSDEHTICEAENNNDDNRAENNDLRLKVFRLGHYDGRNDPADWFAFKATWYSLDSRESNSLST